jgi:myo-inositol catabolism protein IolS
VDRIDLYQVHYPRADVPVADIIGRMSELVGTGKVRFIGVCNFSREQIEEATAVAEISSCQSPYNLLWREIEINGVLDFCREREISVLPYSPLAQGLLAGKFRSRADIPIDPEQVRSRNVLMHGEAFDRSLEVVRLLDEIAARYGKTISQVALNWAINQPGVASALGGARTVAQIEENLRAVGWRLSHEDDASLSNAGMTVSDLLDYSQNMWGNKYAR